MSTFDELLAEGAGVDVSTWGAGFLAGRHVEEPPPWRFPELVRPYLAGADTLLDMGTGDGGKLLELEPLPPHTVAYEDWPPTLPAAVATLQPAGITVVQCEGSVDNNAAAEPDDPVLPFRDGSFDVVVNRHTAFSAHDVHRVLRPGGYFATQQVGRRGAAELRALLGLPPMDEQPWGLPQARAQLEAAGFLLVDSADASVELSWTDVGAFVAYARSAPWEVPEFGVERYRDRLRQLHDGGGIHLHLDLFWVIAQQAS